jgi:hypothetical protein
MRRKGEIGGGIGCRQGARSHGLRQERVVGGEAAQGHCQSPRGADSAPRESAVCASGSVFTACRAGLPGTEDPLCPSFGITAVPADCWPPESRYMSRPGPKPSQPSLALSFSAAKVRA